MKLKLWLASIGTLVLAGILTLTAVAHMIPEDVRDDHPHALSIQTAVRNGWMQGYEDGTFRPDAEITDRQMAKVFDRAYDGNATRGEFADFLVRGFEQDAPEKWTPPIDNFPLPEFCTDLDDSLDVQLLNDFPGETCFTVDLGDTPPDLTWNYRVLGSSDNNDLRCIEYLPEYRRVRNSTVVVRSHMWRGDTLWDCHSIQMVFKTQEYEFWYTFMLEECVPWFCITRYSLSEAVVTEPDLSVLVEERLTIAERVALWAYDRKERLVRDELEGNTDSSWGQSKANAYAWAPYLVEITETALAEATSGHMIREWTIRDNGARRILSWATGEGRDAYNVRPYGSGPDPRLPDPEPVPWDN